MQEKKKLQINKYLFISIVSICAGIFVWWLVTDGLGIFRSNALPSPVKVASTFVKKWFETKPDGATLPVSYTHLDVYKRQVRLCAVHARTPRHHDRTAELP